MTFIKTLLGEPLSSTEDSLIFVIANMSNDTSLSDILAYRLFNPCGAEPGNLDYNRDLIPIDPKTLVPYTSASSEYFVSSDSIITTLDGSTDVLIAIFDLSGKLVKQYTMASEVFITDQNLDLPVGLYYQRIVIPKTNCSMNKLIFLH